MEDLIIKSNIETPEQIEEMRLKYIHNVRRLQNWIRKNEEKESDLKYSK
jgi:hypothetical protein